MFLLTCSGIDPNKTFSGKSKKKGSLNPKKDFSITVYTETSIPKAPIKTEIVNNETTPLLLVTFIFNIITTNKNKTAIAPTYTIIKTNAKNSSLNIRRIKEALQNVKIKNKTE